MIDVLRDEHEQPTIDPQRAAEIVENAIDGLPGEGWPGDRPKMCGCHALAGVMFVRLVADEALESGADKRLALEIIRDACARAMGETTG